MNYTYNINYFYPEDILLQLSKDSQKPVMYINAVGIKNCDDVEKVNEVWDFYYDKCDNQILSGLRQRGELYCYFLTIEQAMQSFHDWFPQQGDLLEDEMHFYFHVRIVDVSSGTDVVNGTYE